MFFGKVNLARRMGKERAGGAVAGEIILEAVEKEGKEGKEGGIQCHCKAEVW